MPDKGSTDKVVGGYSAAIKSVPIFLDSISLSLSLPRPHFFFIKLRLKDDWKPISNIQNALLGEKFQSEIFLTSPNYVKGVKVFVDSAAVMYLLGTEMDYKKEELSSSFVFNNPNETERCGCGESFKIE